MGLTFHLHLLDFRWTFPLSTRTQPFLRSFLFLLKVFCLSRALDLFTFNEYFLSPQQHHVDFPQAEPVTLKPEHPVIPLSNFLFPIQ